MSRTLILALCLCLAGSAAVSAAAGDDSDPFCPGADEGMPGGWTMLAPGTELPEEVDDFADGKVSKIGWQPASAQAKAAAPAPSR